jgi:hypothetical protein
MKKVRFILIGMLLTVLAIGIVSCGSPSQNRAAQLRLKAEQNTMDVLINSETQPVAVEVLGQIGGYTTMYSVKYEGREFVAFVQYKGGVVVLPHTPVERPKVNMDSVVTYGMWLDEYSMLGYTQAEPSKESLESLTNPEVRKLRKAYNQYDLQQEVVDKANIQYQLVVKKSL